MEQARVTAVSVGRKKRTAIDKRPIGGGVRAGGPGLIGEHLPRILALPARGSNWDTHAAVLLKDA